MKPGDFPIGSPESRGAARALLTSRDELRNQIKDTFRLIVTAVGGTNESPRCNRRLGENGVLIEMVYWPDPAWSPEQLRSFVEQHPISRE